MARWSAAQQNLTFVVVADATNFTSAGFSALVGGSTTQRSNILEVYLGGLAGASSPTAVCLALDSTIGGTLTVGTLTALDRASAALAAPPVVFSTATTKPQRSSTLQFLQLSFNAFGGIVRWVAAPGEEIGILGNSTSAGEISLSSLNTGTPGAMTNHIIFEPF